jgi:hypothetical protein
MPNPREMADGLLEVRRFGCSGFQNATGQTLLLRSRAQEHCMCILAMMNRIWHRITRDKVIHQLQLDQSVTIFNDFVPEYVFWYIILIQNESVWSGLHCLSALCSCLRALVWRPVRMACVSNWPVGEDALVSELTSGSIQLGRAFQMRNAAPIRLNNFSEEGLQVPLESVAIWSLKSSSEASIFRFRGSDLIVPRSVFWRGHYMGVIFIPSENIYYDLTVLSVDLDLSGIDYPSRSTFSSAKGTWNDRWLNNWGCGDGNASRRGTRLNKRGDCWIRCTLWILA